MPVDKHNERLLLALFLLSLAGAGLDLAAARAWGFTALTALGAVLAIHALLALAVMARAMLARLAEEEGQADALAARRPLSENLFRSDAEGEEPFTLARSRRLFETRLVPLVAPALCLLQGALAAWLFHGLTAPVLPSAMSVPAASLPNTPVGLAGHYSVAFIAAAEAFLCFLFSRYLTASGARALPETIRPSADGLQTGSSRLLLAPGAMAGLAAWAGVLVAVSAALAKVFPVADRVAAGVVTALLALLAVESGLRAIGEIYRPRKGCDELPIPYESLLARWCAEPRAWSRTLAHSLDYQFGFGFSGTWLYGFLEKAVLPLILFQVLTLYLLTSLVFIGPDEEGILERFGRPREGAWRLASGAHLKWPWPFETVRRFPVGRLQTVIVGHSHEDTREGPKVILWTVPHFEEEFYFLVAGGSSGSADAPGDSNAAPVSLLVMNLPVEYRITNVLQYAYAFSDPARILTELAYRSVNRLAAGSDESRLMGAGRLELAGRLRREIQEESNRLGLGVDIAFVGMQGLHPPVPVADAYEAVVGAVEEKDRAILTAAAESRKTRVTARAQADAKVLEGEAATFRRKTLASAEAALFEKRLDAQRASPEVFRNRLYLRTLTEAIRNVRKFIVTSPADREVLIFNFDEKIKPDLFTVKPDVKEERKP